MVLALKHYGPSETWVAEVVRWVEANAAISFGAGRPARPGQNRMFPTRYHQQVGSSGWGSPAKCCERRRLGGSSAGQRITADSGR